MTDKNLLSQETAQTRKAGRQRWSVIALVSILLWLFFTIYLLRLDQVIGMVVDDAWYVLLARSLASGQGYQMINSPTSGIHPIVPPLFPALLAVCWGLWPDFPANLWLLKSVSIAAMLGVGLISFIYFNRVRGLQPPLALGIAAATVFYPPLVFHATSMVMAECVFMLVQLSAIVVIELAARQTGVLAYRYAVLGGMLAASTYLIRSSGLALLVASVLYLIIERRLRQATIIVLISAFVAGSWIAYSRANVPTAEQRIEQAGSILEPYHEQFWQRMAGNPSAGRITTGELPGRVWKNFSEISRVDMGAVPLYTFYRAVIPGQKVFLSRLAVWFSLALTALSIIGFVSMARRRPTLAEFVVPLSLAMTLLWAWEQFRFLLPLIPFLIFYQLMGLRSLVLLLLRTDRSSSPPIMEGALATLVWAMVALNVYANSSFILRQYNADSPMNWHRDFSENAAILRYAKERLPAEAVLATQNPALVHLFTGHKTVAFAAPGASWEMWKRTGVRYLLYASPNPLPPSGTAEDESQTIYRQTGRLNLRIVELGPSASRQVEGKH